MSDETPTLPTGAEQAEFNLGDSAAMRSAMDAAVRDVAQGGPAPTAEMIAEAKQQATKLINTLDPEMAEGLRDLKNLTLSMGLPATRAVFRHMVVASGVRGAPKAEALQEIREFSPLTEVGCMKVDFHNMTTGKPDVAYLVLGECPKGHVLSRELDKVKAHVSPDKWQEVLRHLSVLIGIGRNVYTQVAQAHVGLIRKLFGLPAEDACARYCALQVDMANTTLFVDASWPTRIGIYVRSEADAKGQDVYAPDGDEAHGVGERTTKPTARDGNAK